jgi:putative cardiolipin synthase
MGDLSRMRAPALTLREDATGSPLPRADEQAHELLRSSRSPLPPEASLATRRLCSCSLFGLLFGSLLGSRPFRIPNSRLSPRLDSLRRLLPRAGRVLVLSTCTVVLAACATRPPASDFKREMSYSLSQSTPTQLGDALAAREVAHPGQNGFELLPTGSAALQARLALANAAQRTLDMQYYIATEDDTGNLVLNAALRAADRGVRVRFLVDDLNFKDLGDVMATLNAHPKIEIRVFNPFATASQGPIARVTNAMTHLDSLTRRMHNKALIVDNQVAVVGGRNLGDEYFDASPNLVFRDLDLVVAGPLVTQVSASFDEFWNSEESYPLRALNTRQFDRADIERVRRNLDTHWQKEFADISNKPLYQAPFPDLLTRESAGLVWARGELQVDTPAKIDPDNPDYESPPAHRLGELIRASQTSVDVISPYFVPHDEGVDSVRRLTEHGVHFRILTNSLAATDAIAVHAGYSPYRVPLLKAGAELYEFKPLETSVHVGGMTGSRSRASLHAKAYVIDRKIAVIGSMNLDRRSVGLNTELTVVVHSPVIAEQVEKLFDRGISPDASYRVTLAPASLAPRDASDLTPSLLQWDTEDNGIHHTYNYDPDAGLWRNFITGIFSMLPVRDQL